MAVGPMVQTVHHSKSEVGGDGLSLAVFKMIGRAVFFNCG